MSLEPEYPPMDTSGLWECDGCSFTGTYEEAEQHVIEVNTGPDGEHIPDQDVVCWGTMLVGGKAWTDFHEHGKHPMEYIRDQVEQMLMDNTEALAEVFKEMDEDKGGD